MLYREVGQYKTNYAADMAVFPILQDRIGLAVILLIALGRAELRTEDETAKLWYEQQRTAEWSSFLADALKVLAQTMQPADEIEHGTEEAVA